MIHLDEKAAKTLQKNFMKRQEEKEKKKRQKVSERTPILPPAKPIARSKARESLHDPSSPAQEVSYGKIYVIDPVPKDPELQKNLAEELFTWSFLDEALDIVEFPLKKHFAPRKFYAIAKTNEYFADGLSAARENIGRRLKAKWRSGELSWDYVKQMLPLYDADYKDEQDSRRIAFQKTMNERAGTMKIEVTQVPSSPLVPDKSVYANTTPDKK